MSDVFAAPESSSAPPATTKPKAYEVGPLPGGSLPDVGKILTDTFAEFGDNLGPYAMAGLGHFMVMMPVAIVIVILGYVLILGGMFGTFMVGTMFSVMLAEVSEDLGGLGIMLTSVLSVVLPVLLFFGFIGFVGACLAPLHASLVRAVAKHQRGEEQLTLGSAFTHATDNLVSIVLVALATTCISLFLLSMCYLPALAVPVLLPFAGTLVALHRRGAVDGLRTALGHSTGNLSWYVMFGLLTFAGGMVAGYVPVLGAMFMTAFHVRAYRHLFGDAAEPVISTQPS